MLSQKILIERIEKWMSPIYWADVNVRSAMYGEYEADVTNLCVYEPRGTSRPLISTIIPLLDQFQPTSIGTHFGPSWSSKWFHFSVDIPDQMDAAIVCLKWDSNSEAMIYNNEGKPLQAFTGGGGSDRRDLYVIDRNATSGDHMSFFVEMACNEMFGNGDGGMIKPPAPNKTFTLSTVKLVTLNQIGHDLFWDMSVMYDMVQSLAENSPTASAALALMTQIINDVDLKSEESMTSAHRSASAFFESKECKVDHDIFAFGHCHIDTAWLWPYAETRRKVARSWVTQCDLLRRYSAYKFVASQTVQFEWLMDDHPEVLEDIRGLVRDGKFIPVGGTYVEFDAYMPSGESMVRQFLYGMELMKQQFEISPKIFWLPDTFGYSSQLPQIINGFGMKYFLSQKLSWNLLNV